VGGHVHLSEFNTFGVFLDLVHDVQEVVMDEVIVFAYFQSLAQNVYHIFSTCVGTNLQIVYFDIHLRRSSFLIGGNTSITKNLKTAELSTEENSMASFLKRLFSSSKHFPARLKTLLATLLSVPKFVL
jgi:hypothetical protein